MSGNWISVVHRLPELNVDGSKVFDSIDVIATDGIQSWWFGDYVPTQEAIEINRNRIEKRLK